MRKRLTRKEKRNRNKKIVITGAICLLFCLCVGYAALNTELSIRAKGNIKESENCEFGGIKVNTVTEGDGLYFDTYEEGFIVGIKDKILTEAFKHSYGIKMLIKIHKKIRKV